MKKTVSIVFAMLVIASMVLAACAPEAAPPVVQTVVVTQVVEKEGKQVVVTQVVEKEVTPTPAPVNEPVTLDWNFGTEPPTIDPALATDTTSVDVVANLFVGLTQFDPNTSEVMPYLATEWEQGEDADGNQTWTYHLRNDIPWVRYDPISGEFSQETDENGNPRMVNANDVVYGVKRTLDPATASDYAYVLYIIKNGQAFNTGAEGVTADDVGVAAPDDQTVVFTLEEPAGYFPAIASMWVAKPQPQWAIEENPDKWTEAGLIVTNGPYGLESWIHGGELNMIKNPMWINADQVQIERVHGVMITEASTAFALYENNELDTAGVPLPEMDRVKADPVLSKELKISPDVCTYYYGFTNTKPPFDDVRVRKAFIQSIDRQSLIDNVLKGGQIPATTFAPPGIFGAPEPGTLGLQYDPEAAKASLQEYLDEKGMTIDDFNNMGITLMYNTSEGHARIAAAIQQMWKDTLGVNVNVENQEWKVYLETIKKETPVQDEPGIWRMGWCADYPDENNWVYEVFYSGEGFENRLRRNCDDPNCGSSHLSEFDNLVAQAKLETDPAKRAEMYAQAEDILAAQEAAYAPIYHYTKVNVTKPWLTRNYPLLGGNDFFNWKIDMAAKLDAQGM
jgi:oligopeptide transport system substrate-binding protein